ncbi:MAG: putative glycoside hydrolase [bacterium]|nr:putative glycoside hydrolase [bacterium]MDZ4284885.1 putative glycoside hydrolase [Patescibacteria group bacterium]
MNPPPSRRASNSPFVAGAVLAGALAAGFFGAPDVARTRYELAAAGAGASGVAVEAAAEPALEPKREPPPIYLPTPEPLKAIYMSQCVAGTPSFRDRLVRLIDETELNAVVIDVKDYSGGIGFPTSHPMLTESVSAKCGARDMRAFLRTLKEKNIYAVARITVFQDPHYSALHPELAVTKASATTTLWRDNKGLSFIDVGARPYWEYIVAVARQTHALGFDELNFDYIRYPSDGPMGDIYFPWSDAALRADPERGDARMLRDFFAYLREELVEQVPEGEHAPVLSADLFGMTTTNEDDLNIGQLLEYALPYFDYISPMVYPSHYPRGFRGLANPAAEPYEVIHYSMGRAVERVVSYRERASTTAAVAEGRIRTLQLRPWLQDFDLGAIYTPELIRAEMQAVYDSALTSWMLWDPANQYTREALTNE